MTSHARDRMSDRIFKGTFVLGLAAALWVGWGFLGTHGVALVMTAVIVAVYLVGSEELRQFRKATAALEHVVAATAETPADLGQWLARLPAPLQGPVQARLESGRGALPAPALTPYLAGLLVMLGMLGTFLGMVLTFRGAVFALQGSADLQAMRAALAEPIKGLGLSFGTSVAGVATSAMLGLMAAIARRERLEVLRRLDRLASTVMRNFSAAQRRDLVLHEMQAQGGALPEVASRLVALADALEQRHSALAQQLLASQDRFQREAGDAYTALAERVGESLRHSLVEASRQSGEQLVPVLESAMGRIERQGTLALEQIGQQSALAHERQAELAERQVESLSSRFESTADAAAAAWRDAVAQQAAANEKQAQALSEALDTVVRSLEQRSAELLAGIGGQAEQLVGELAGQSRGLVADVTGQAAGLMQGVTVQAGQLVDGLSREARELVASAQAGIGQAVAGVQAQLAQLRDEEAGRAAASLVRMESLEAAAGGHLANLGAALEAPLARLLQTAAEVPQAGAQLMSRLREEMGALAERDKVTLQERTVLLERLGTLVDALERSGGQQEAAVASLAGAATQMIDRASARFEATLAEQGRQSADSGARLQAGAIELSSMAEAFADAMQQYQAGTDRLVATLAQVEAGLERAAARSDEQLAYYVAQAREVIDLSIASQQGLVESLRLASGKRQVPTSGAVGAAVAPAAAQDPAEVQA